MPLPLSTRRFLRIPTRDDPALLERIARELEEEHIEIEAFNSDSEGVHLLTDYPDKAREVLSSLGIDVTVEEVLQYQFEGYGRLTDLARRLAAAEVRLEGSFGQSGYDAKGPVFLRVSDVRAAERALGTTTFPMLVGH